MVSDPAALRPVPKRLANASWDADIVKAVARECAVGVPSLSAPSVPDTYSKSAHARILSDQDICQIATVSEFEAAIRGGWERSQDEFVLIGRLLRRAKDRLPWGEFEGMVATLPFSQDVAHRFMKVALAIDSGRLPADRLPKSYNTIDRLASLTDAEIAQADQAGVIRPDVQRKEVDQFRASLRRPAADSEAEKKELAQLLKRRQLIDEKIAELQRKIEGQ